MINASREFKEKLKQGFPVVNYADITLRDGTVLNLSPSDFMLGGCTVEDKTTDGRFGVGYVIGKTLNMRIANHDERFSPYDFYYSTIVLYVAMELDNGTIEKIRKGKYYTTIPETPGSVIELSAVDGMYLLDKDYSPVPTGYPATLQTILSDICLFCGIPIGFSQFDRCTFSVQERPEETTCRQVFAWACQMAGYNARIDNSGYMQLVWYNTTVLDTNVYEGGDFFNYPHNTVIDGGNFTDYSASTVIDGGNFTDRAPENIFLIKTLSVVTDDVRITGVRIKTDEAGYQSGEDGYVIEIDNNPFVKGCEQDTADYLGTRLVGVMFRPFSADVLQNPLYEPFDMCELSDRKGNIYHSLINSVTYTTGAYTRIACEADSPIRNESAFYSEPSRATVAEAKKNVKTQIDIYDKAVQNMNELSTNSMGFHTTYEEQPDGSRITYLHDKPTLGESRIIYKQTIDGFFLSTDGGQSYTAGFDSEGNAVVNILSAIGIVFDWARGGTLSLGGVGNGNGAMKILDNSSGVIGRWDNAGFSTSGKWFSVTQEGAMYSNNPAISGRMYLASTVSGKADIDEIERTKAVFAFSAFKTSTGSDTGRYELYIANNSDQLGWYIDEIDIKKSTMFGENVTVRGNLKVWGENKNRIVQTKSYSNRPLYSYEMPSALFGDVGDGKTDKNGECYIFLDDIFLETVNIEMAYHVFLQECGEGKLWVEERCGEYFLVKGTPNLPFSWEVKCRQRRSTYGRMEDEVEENSYEIVKESDDDQESISGIARAYVADNDVDYEIQGLELYKNYIEGTEEI